MLEPRERFGEGKERLRRWMGGRWRGCGWSVMGSIIVFNRRGSGGLDLGFWFVFLPSLSLLFPLKLTGFLGSLSTILECENTNGSWFEWKLMMGGTRGKPQNLPGDDQESKKPNPQANLLVLFLNLRERRRERRGKC